MQLWERRNQDRFVPGVKDTSVTENKGVRWVEILNEIGDKAVIANNEPAGNGP